MEAASTTVSTLMVLMSVSVEAATDCLEMDNLALVRILTFSILASVRILDIEYCLQISMSVHQEHTDVITYVLTLMAPSPVPVTVDMC